MNKKNKVLNKTIERLKNICKSKEDLEYCKNSIDIAIIDMEIKDLE